MAKVPPVFVSHGSALLAVDPARGAELEAWARSLPAPRGILIVSAHWETQALTRGSTAAQPPLLHDYDLELASRLANVTYPAPGAPELAYELHQLARIERDSERGWDHGVCAPLVHMFPNADVPVLQLSLPTGATARRLYGIGRKIGVLAERGYLLIGSGGITNNEAQAAPDPDAAPASFARDFDGWIANLLADAEMDLLAKWRSRGPRAKLAHPTTEHLGPLFVVAGAASLYEHAVGFPLRGFAHGTMSLRCVQFGR
jgi:4,5-DOPA dioxygenase extradiol